MAAKLVRISNDNGATWAKLPGSEASFSAETDGINDAILGHTFDSTFPGLTGWKITSNGIFKGFAGYNAKISKIGVGATVTDSAMSLVSGKIYKITDATKQVWNRSATITVKDNSVTVAASNIEWIDYLFGQVKFASSYTVTGPVTVSCTYYPTSELGKGNSYTLTMQANARDESNFPDCRANGGYKIFKPGLRTVSLQLAGIFTASTAAAADLQTRSEFIIEIDAAGDGKSIARGFFRYSNIEQAGAVGAVEDETLNFTLSVPDDALMKIPFSWVHNSGTTLSTAIQYAITAWLDELDTYDAQYLATGVEGNSPADGREGNVIFTDISLSGGLSNMNVFSIDMQGTGAFTEV